MQERHAAKRFGHLDAVGACMGVNLQMLRAQTKGQRRAQRRQPDRDRQRGPKPGCINLTCTADPCCDKVHRGRADKACNEFIIGVAVQIQRCPHLFDPPRAQHHDLVGQRHRLDLIMGDIDHRRTDFAVQSRDFHPHFHPQFGIKVRERFVKQEHLGATHNRAPDGDALALTARQGLGFAR